ncbi:MAG: hypothetical protein IJ371_00385 [Clostridia bacterium]|nr:hypothetical protein [Clostridia bacterium]
MTFIQKLIDNQTMDEKKCNNIINKCIKLDELDLYLHNLDRIAQLSQKSNANIEKNSAINILEQRNEKLLSIIHNKITKIIENYNIDIQDIICYADKVKYALDGVDIVDMKPVQNIQAQKTYLITDIIVKHFSSIQQKTL